ncbi:MAG TPA: serine/threonine-protein kinase [Chroococcales cyanobacterium]
MHSISQTDSQTDARKDLSQAATTIIVEKAEEQNLIPIPAAGAGSEGGSGREPIGPYLILDEIGAGGMGIVYRVRHKAADKIMAMKVLRDELAADPVSVKRFQQELKTTSSLTHPNIVPIYDSGTSDRGLPYFVMEYLDGVTLQQLLEDEGYLDLERFQSVFSQVCEAISLAHEKRTIHRDLKPSNIAVTSTESGFELVKVLDFGIARVFQRASKEATKLTQMGEIIGSPIYMSPEQCLNQKLDERSDIYSLGVVMYECLAGAPPFVGENAIEIIMAHLHGKPASISKLRPDFAIPADLEALIATCMEKDPAARFQSVRELMAEMDRVFSAIRQSGLLWKCRRSMRRSRAAIKKRWKLFLKSQKSVPATLAAGSLLMVCLAGAVNLLTPQISDNYIDRAESAMLHDNAAAIRTNWDLALASAEKTAISKNDLAALYERAADNLLCHMQISLYVGDRDLVPSPYGPGKENQSAANESELIYAQEHYKRALQGFSGSDDKIRTLDKLIAIASQQGRSDEKEKYLRQRIALAEGGSSIDPRNQNAYQEHAILLEQKGHPADAELFWQKAVACKQADPQNGDAVESMKEFANFLNRHEKYEKELAMRQKILDIYLPQSQNGYDYEIGTQKHLIANCLDHLGRHSEASAMLKSIPPEKKAGN